MSPSAVPLAVIHIPRTGGRSLGRAIKDRYGAKAHKVKAWSIAAAHLDGAPEDVEIIFGHMNYGAHRHRAVRYATVLRDPVGRCISHFRMGSNWRRLHDLPARSLEEFVSTSRGANLQTQLLAGVFGEAAQPPLEDMQALAQSHLEAFAQVGFLDRLDDFAGALDLKTPLPRWDDPEFPPYRPTPEEIELVKAANAADLALVAWARERWSGASPAAGCRPFHYKKDTT